MWESEEARRRQRQAEREYKKRLMRLGRQAKDILQAQEAERRRWREGVATLKAAVLELTALVPAPPNPARRAELQRVIAKVLEAIARL